VSNQYQGPLTPKEQKVVDEFENARPGLGEHAERNVRSPNTGWREIIDGMSDEEIKAEASSRNKG
jgi:hypothetical protein